MDVFIPSAEQVRDQLEELTHAQMQELARISTVPFTTLWKVRGGDTTNPGLETVRKFWPHIADIVERAKAAPAGEAA